MSVVSWVHLSDLHAGGPDSWATDEIVESLARDLRKFQEEYSVVPQLLFFTGDLVYGEVSGGRDLDEQYRDASEVLRVLRETFTPSIEKQNMFLVPGNHDVRRSKVTQALRKRAGDFTSADEVNALMAEADQEWKDFIRRLERFGAFLEGEAFGGSREFGEQGFFAEERSLDGCRLGIGGLNTAWASYGGRGEKGRIPMGVEYQMSTLWRGLKDTEFKVFLAHHPPGWAYTFEEHKYRRGVESLAQVFLHGHEHEGWGTEVDRRHVQIPAAACYDRKSRENGYSVVKLTTVDDGVELEVWFRRYDKDGRGWVPRAILNKTDERGRWVVALGSRKDGVTTGPPRDLEQGDGDTSTLLPNLPPRPIFQPTPPLGREEERDECVTLLRDHRAILLHGLPGQGKTALALYVAQHLQESFPDGAYEVSLQNEDRIENIVRLIGVTLGDPDGTNSFKLLKTKRALIILDSFERAFRRADRETLGRFLELLIHALSGDSRVIITSQVEFQFAGLIPKPVRELRSDPATALFHMESERLYEDEPREEIERIVVDLLGGHPLSIKIVARYSLAAKVPLSTLVQLWTEKWEEIASFPGPLGEKNLEVAFELSFASLDYTQRRVFLAFALLPDGIFGEHISRIWSDDTDKSVRALAELDRRSLVQSDRHWYKVLGPTYAYARAKRREVESVQAEGWDQLSRDEAATDSVYDGLVAEYAPQPEDADPRDKNRVIREHFHNIHASLDRRLEPSTSKASLQAALSVMRLYWAYHNNLSGYKTTIASAEDAVHYLSSSRDIFKIHGAHLDSVMAEYYIGSIQWLRGETERARPLLEEVGDNPLTPRNVRYNIKRALAHMEYKTGSIRSAVSLYEEALEDARSIDDDECRWRCVIGLIDAWRKLEEYEQCTKLFEQVEAELEDMHPSIRGNVLRGYAYAVFCQGNAGEAKRLYDGALRIFETVSPFGQAHCRRGLGDVFVRQNLLAEAETEFDLAIKLYDEAGKNPSLGSGLVELGRARLALARGDKARALERLREAAHLFDRDHQNEPYELAQTYELIGNLHREVGRVDDAVGNYQLALNLYASSEVEAATERVKARIEGARVE